MLPQWTAHWMNCNKDINKKLKKNSKMENKPFNSFDTVCTEVAVVEDGGCVLVGPFSAIWILEVLSLWFDWLDGVGSWFS